MSSIVERAETLAEASAGGPVEDVQISKRARSADGRGTVLSDPARFAVYYRLPEDPKTALRRMAPMCLTLDEEELRALEQAR